MSELLDKIIEAKGILGDKQAEIIASGYPLEEWNPEKGSAKSIFNANDNTPSMMWMKKDYYFKDFSTGKVFGILDYYMYKYNEPYMKAVKRLFDETKVSYDSSIFDFTNTKDKKSYFKNFRYPKIEHDISGIALDYMAKRGISEETCRYVGLGSDAYNNVAYQFRDLDGRVVTVKYRPSHAVKNGEPKYFYQKNADTCPILFNINKIDVTQPLLIVEGMNDCMACIEAGFKNVVSIPSGANDDNWINFNYEFLDQFESIILWFDNDDAGESGAKKTAPRLGEYRIKLVKPTDDDEESVYNFYHRFNQNVNIHKTDANNILLSCGAARILALINSAEEIPMESIIDLMSVEEFDIEQTEYIPSGISALDKQIYGFVDGTLNIWTAYSGVGKTTMISQSCVLEAIDRGETVFWFNAESTTSQMLNWILAQAAGRQHSVEYTGPNGFQYYKPTPQAAQAIKQYYSGKIFVYDNLLLSNPDMVFNKMKEVYKRFGTKVFVVDNWLCLNFRGISDTEVTGIQVDFMNKLIHFAKQNNLEVHLICHPRKQQSGIPLSEYEILGSSNIVNMADRIYGLEKVWDNDLKAQGFDRQFTVFKDRVLGTHGERIGLRYDRVTRRLYSDGDDKFKSYSWDKGLIKYNTPIFGKNGLLVDDRVLDYETEIYNNTPY